MAIREAGRVRARARPEKPPHPVRAQREAAGMTLTRLARLARISFTTLWRIENRLVTPRSSTLDRLEKVLRKHSPR